MNLILDLSYLTEISDGDSEFIASILSTFVEETPKDIINMKQALAKSNIDQIGKLAHKNKSTLQLLGLLDLKQLAFDIEQAAKNNDTSIIPEAESFLTYISEIIPIVESELTKFS